MVDGGALSSRTASVATTPPHSDSTTMWITARISGAPVVSNRGLRRDAGIGADPIRPPAW